MTPILIAALVGIIGIVGIFSALHASSCIRREINILGQGRRVLDEIPIEQPRDFDYRSWLNEHSAGLIDSHFGDHLFAAADATRSGRALTLHEFHQLSIRREARRKAARLSGGITALLLVCGIAGTLLAIEPILGGFHITTDSAGISDAADNVEKATRLIQSLGQAFLPSLVALGLTVIVAFSRGIYTHSRGHLAGKLDELDLQDLFHRFPPPSISRELNDVRAQLAELATQMLASQRNLDGFVDRLSSAASGFHNDAPPLQKASDLFVRGVMNLRPPVMDLNTTIIQHFGNASPLIEKLDGLRNVASLVQGTTADMQAAGVLLHDAMEKTHRLLQAAANSAGEQIQKASESTIKSVAEAASKALESIFEGAAERIDIVTAPLILAAETVATENQALKTGTEQVVEQLSIRVHEIISDCKETMQEELKQGNEAMLSRFDGALSQAQQDFAGAIKDTLDTMKGIDAQNKEVHRQLQDNMLNILQLHDQIRTLILESQDVEKNITAVRDEIGQASNLSQQTAQDLGSTTESLLDAVEKSLSIIEHLDEIGEVFNTANVKSQELRIEAQGLQETQRETTAQITAVLDQAAGMSDVWAQLISATTAHQQNGMRFKEDVEALLERAGVVARELAHNSETADQYQRRIASELEKIAPLIEELTQMQKTSVLGRFLGNRGQ